MKNLDEMIKHYEEIAENQEWMAENYNDDSIGTKLCKECASEHRQIAEWLRNYKQIIESGDCNNCRNGKCEWKPLGRLVRYNCPHYVGISDGGK